MKIQFIKGPGSQTLQILANRSVTPRKYENIGAVGLVQGRLADMIRASDIAEKTADVKVEEIRGICPQHFTMIAIYGDIAAVEASLKAIEQELGGDRGFLIPSPD